MQGVVRRNSYRLGAVALAAAGLQAFPGKASAAYVHTQPLPSVAVGINASFDKSTSDFMYLEGEASQGSNTYQSTANYGGQTTYSYTGDSTHTSFSTSASVTLASFTDSSSNQYAAYGSDGTNLVNFYWADEQVSLTPGSYDVFARAYVTTNGAYTFTLYTGTNLSDVTNGTAAATGTTSGQTAGSPRWYKIGTVALDSTTDSFRLQINTTASAVRLDSLFFAAVPEPSSLAMIGLAGGALLRRRASKRG